jgi:hypothetical protein
MHLASTYILEFYLETYYNIEQGCDTKSGYDGCLIIGS